MIWSKISSAMVAAMIELLLAAYLAVGITVFLTRLFDRRNDIINLPEMQMIMHVFGVRSASLATAFSAAIAAPVLILFWPVMLAWRFFRKHR